MLEVKVLYLAGWLIVAFSAAERAEGKPWLWCLGEAIGCVLWPAGVIIAALRSYSS
jgi:hypothetical protein